MPLYGLVPLNAQSSWRKERSSFGGQRSRANRSCVSRASSKEMTTEEETTSALLQDRFGPKVRPIAYVCHLPRITAKAREFGYAIAVHGSLQRDMDLIAVPWSQAATDEEELLKAICETVGGFRLEHQTGADKPHGRRAWTIHLGAGLFIDLSIMPRREA